VQVETCCMWRSSHCHHHDCNLCSRVAPTLSVSSETNNDAYFDDIFEAPRVDPKRKLCSIIDSLHESFDPSAHHVEWYFSFLFLIFFVLVRVRDACMHRALHVLGVSAA